MPFPPLPLLSLSCPGECVLPHVPVRCEVCVWTRTRCDRAWGMCQGTLCKHVWLSMALGRWLFRSRVGTLRGPSVCECGVVEVGIARESVRKPWERVCVYGPVYVTEYLYSRTASVQMCLCRMWPAGARVCVCVCVSSGVGCALCGLRACVGCSGWGGWVARC